MMVFALLGCQESAYDHLAEARQEFEDAAYLEAINSADAGLQAGPDERVAWGLELVKLDAYARGGYGEYTSQQLERLVALHPDRIPPSQYSATAHQLRSAGDGASAIVVLDMGLERYPGDPVIERLIAASSASPSSDPAELDMLKTLGYIE